MTYLKPSVLLLFLTTTTTTAGLLTGCAPTTPELISARNAYQQASDGPAATLVPADLHKAKEALELAESAFEDEPRGYHAKDLAYVAQRKAELADALATRAAQSQLADSADAQYQKTQDAIMAETRSQLGSAREDLAASQISVATGKAELSASEDARVLAEARASEALAALSKLAAVKQEPRGVVITLSGSVLFRSDESNLLPEAQSRLSQVADALLATKDRAIVIEGHTDSQGSDAHNLELSKRRAMSVRTFLVDRGYDATLIRAVGIGEESPLADNATAEGRANNRRVEIVILPSTSTSSL